MLSLGRLMMILIDLPILDIPLVFVDILLIL